MEPFHMYEMYAYAVKYLHKKFKIIKGWVLSIVDLTI